MKLRLQADSIRVRLSEEEVRQLGRDGNLRESIILAPGKALEYHLELAAVDRPAVSIQNSAIRIRIPDVAANAWIESSETALQAPESPAGIASVIVERDIDPAQKHKLRQQTDQPRRL